MRLEDLIPDYPDANDPRLQAKLAAAPEFAEVKGLLREPVPLKGTYYMHQRAVLRYLRIYDRLFLYHKMGTGKTGAMKSVGSFYKYKRYGRPVIPLGTTITKNRPDLTVRVKDLGAYGPTPLPPPGSLLHEREGEIVGVSAAVDALVEFMSEWDNDIQHCFVLVKGPFLRNEFERQIACELADPGEYDLTPARQAAINNSADPSRTRRNAIRRETRKWFTVETSNKFVEHYLSRYDPAAGKRVLLSPSELEAKFKNCLFFVDEVHVLFNEARDSIPTSSHTPANKAMTSFHATYQGLFKLFHSVKGIKVVLASGTPMINNANEIKSEMNLILPIDQQMPPELDVNTATFETLEPYFRGRLSYVRELDTGAQLVLQGEHFDLNINGKTIESADTIYMSDMSEFQSDVYTRVVEEGIRGKRTVVDADEEEEESEQLVINDADTVAGPLGIDMTALDAANDFDFIAALEANANAASEVGTTVGKKSRTRAPEKVAAGGAFHRREIYASAFVFPDKSIGGKVRKSTTGKDLARSGLGRYVYSPARNVFRPTREFIEAVNTIPKLKKHSCIMGEIVEKTLAHRGKSFVFTPNVQGGGAIVAAMCYEANGVTRFNSPSSVLVNIGRPHGPPTAVELSDSDEASDDLGIALRDGEIEIDDAAARGNVCGSRVQNIRRIGIPKGLRYALITSEMTENELNAVLELWNAPENIHGEYLAILIGSPIARDGLNLTETTMVHVFASWNKSSTLQAIARVDRANAFIILLKEMEARLRREGRDPNTAVVEVKVYKHAALPIDPDVRSIDLDLYASSERKDREIKRIERFMMRSSFDCHLNYARNVRPTDVDGSPECAYGECDYECAAPMTKEERRAFEDPTAISAMLLTSDDRRLDELGDRIVEKLAETPTTRVDRLAMALGETKQWVALAADRLARLRRVVLDRWGYPCIVVAPSNGGGIVTLHRSFELVRGQTQDPFDGYGTTHLGMISAHVPLDEMHEESVVTEEAGDLDSLTVPQQIRVLEDAVNLTIAGRQTIETRKVLVWFERYLFAIREPKEDLARAEERLAKRGQGRGRRAKIGSELRLKFDIGPAEVVTGFKAVRLVEQCASGCSPWVLIHTLDSKNVERTSYSISSQIHHIDGRLRVYDSGRWRDATLAETPVYKDIIQRERDKIYESYGDLFGSVFEDKTFRIHDQAKAKGGVTIKGQHNKREEARGKACKTWTPAELVQIAARLNLAPEDETVPSKLSKTQMKELESLSGGVERTNAPIEWVNAPIAWAWWKSIQGYKARESIQKLCDAIEEEFRKEGKLDVV